MIVKLESPTMTHTEYDSDTYIPARYKKKVGKKAAKFGQIDD